MTHAALRPFRSAPARHVREINIKKAEAMAAFNYNTEAELFPAAIRKKKRAGFAYRRFPTAAEAVQFAIEQLPPSAQPSAIMEMGDERIAFAQIRAHYDSERYPMIRADGQRQDLALASVAQRAAAGAAPPHGRERNGR